jgi:hypothetical protein
LKKEGKYLISSQLNIWVLSSLDMMKSYFIGNRFLGDGEVNQVLLPNAPVNDGVIAIPLGKSHRGFRDGCF